MMTPPVDAQGFICLGASAGGLRSIDTVLRGLGQATPWPILISQHMQPEHESQLPALLARSTGLPVHEAVAGVVPRPGHVYVSPSSSEMGVSPEGRLTLREPAAGRPQRVDHLFSTAAFTRPGLVIAVVLSGTGSDGAAGALVVKLSGGTVLVEDAQSAQHSGMPDAAIQAGAVDAPRSATELGALISALAGGALRESSEAANGFLRRIAKALATHAQTDFEGYRLATLRRRVEKRRVLAGAPNLEAYAEIVEHDPVERDLLVQSLLIPVTEFFRDPATWQGIEADLLPSIVERANEGEAISIWCAGCATGEEAYTIAMLMMERVRDMSRVEIVATDLNADAIAHARRGSFPSSRVHEVSSERLERFFARDRDGSAYRVRDDLRSAVRFEVQDVTKESPPGQFDLVICRNVLIYFEQRLQAVVLERFRRALRPDGTLFLGRSEVIPRHEGIFATSGPKLRLFRPKESAASLVDGARPGSGEAGTGPGDVANVSPTLLADSDALLLVVDGNWRITSANARAEQVLGRALTGAGLLDLLPAWQGSPVHDALRTSLSTGRSIRVTAAPAPSGRLDLLIEPFPPGARTLLVVAHPTAARPRRVDALPSEIDLDLTATNEELQAANEALAAANEELQASNEELASLNEEFQATNENLATTNAELRASAQPYPSTLLRAVLARSPEAIVVCDDHGRVVLFNREAGRVLGLGQDHIGHALDPRIVGLPHETLRAWLETLVAGSPVKHSSGRIAVSAERVVGDAGDAGWLLTFDPAMQGP